MKKEKNNIAKSLSTKASAGRPANEAVAGKYQKFLDDMEALYRGAKNAITEAGWKMGRRIVEIEQDGEIRAAYGTQLIPRMSRDLTARLGTGFSKTNLARMRTFYLENPIFPHAGKLGWSQHTELLAVKDMKKRRLLEKKILKENLNRNDARALIHQENVAEAVAKASADPDKPAKQAVAGKPVPKLSVTRSKLFTYKVVEPSYIHPAEGKLVIDLGFDVRVHTEIKGLRLKDGEIIESAKSNDTYSFKRSDAAPKELYTYKALVERVVDADTFVLDIDLGFSSWIREKVRLRGIDCPELSTPEGKKAKAFVEAKLKQVNFVVVKTYKDDKYGRVLADVFYSPGEDDPEVVLEKGIFLNQELLDNGLAVLM